MRTILLFVVMIFSAQQVVADCITTCQPKRTSIYVGARESAIIEAGRLQCVGTCEQGKLLQAALEEIRNAQKGKEKDETKD